MRCNPSSSTPAAAACLMQRIAVYYELFVQRSALSRFAVHAYSLKSYSQE